MRESRRLELLAEKLLKFLGKDKAAVAVFLADDAIMRRLNRAFLGRNSSTNVLSFPAPNFPKVIRRDFLGEIYLNPTYIRKRKEDMIFMMIHGLLHLLGYNHEAKSDRMKMEKMEIKLLSWLKARS